MIRRVPETPMFIRALPEGLMDFDSVEALAAHVHQLRGKRGLEVTAQVAGYDGFDTFPILAITAVDKDGGAAEWLGAAAVQGMSAAEFLAVVKATRPGARKAA